MKHSAWKVAAAKIWPKTSVLGQELTSRQMNTRFVRKSLSSSKQLRLLRAASSWEDWIYNVTRPVKTLRLECTACSGQQRRQARTLAMAAGLTDHIWTVKELLMTVVLPSAINTK